MEENFPQEQGAAIGFTNQGSGGHFCLRLSGSVARNIGSRNHGNNVTPDN